MASQTTAILTFAHLVTVQAFNADDTLAGAALSLQTRSVKPKKTRSKIDMTNALSNGKAEWAPGVLVGAFPLAGVFDPTVGAVDLIFTTIMDAALYAQCVFYLIKPGVGLNPITYTGRVLFTDCELDWETDSGGKVAMFSADGTIVGNLARGGADTTGALVRGNVQA